MIINVCCCSLVHSWSWCLTVHLCITPCEQLLLNDGLIFTAGYYLLWRLQFTSWSPCPRDLGPARARLVNDSQLSLAFRISLLNLMIWIVLFEEWRRINDLVNWHVMCINYLINHYVSWECNFELSGFYALWLINHGWKLFFSFIIFSIFKRWSNRIKILLFASFWTIWRGILLKILIFRSSISNQLFNNVNFSSLLFN